MAKNYQCVERGYMNSYLDEYFTNKTKENPELVASFIIDHGNFFERILGRIMRICLKNKHFRKGFVERSRLLNRSIFTGITE